MHEIAGKKMHNFMSLFSVVGRLKNSAQFFVLVDGGWSSNSCMKLLEKKVRMVRHFILLHSVVFESD